MMVKKNIEHKTLTDLSLGDTNAYKHIFQIYYAQVRQFALMFLKRADDADDVAQMVFMKLWLKRATISEVRDFDSYLFVLTKHTTLRYGDAHKTTPIPIDHVYNMADTLTPSLSLEEKDLRLLVEMVVENMPLQRQKIYRMSREQHMKNEEIAIRLGIKKKTVENHLNIALNEIRKAICLLLLIVLDWV